VVVVVSSQQAPPSQQAHPIRVLHAPPARHAQLRMETVFGISNMDASVQKITFASRPVFVKRLSVPSARRTHLQGVVSARTRVASGTPRVLVLAKPQNAQRAKRMVTVSRQGVAHSPPAAPALEKPTL